MNGYIANPAIFILFNVVLIVIPIGIILGVVFWFLNLFKKKPKKEVEVKLYTANPNPVIQTCSGKVLEDSLHMLKLEKMGYSELVM